MLSPIVRDQGRYERFVALNPGGHGFGIILLAGFKRLGTTIVTDSFLAGWRVIPIENCSAIGTDQAPSVPLYQDLVGYFIIYRDLQRPSQHTE